MRLEPEHQKMLDILGQRAGLSTTEWARLAAVSETTVRRYTTGLTLIHVEPQTYQRVLEAALQPVRPAPVVRVVKTSRAGGNQTCVMCGTEMEGTDIALIQIDGASTGTWVHVDCVPENAINAYTGKEFVR